MSGREKVNERAYVAGWFLPDVSGQYPGYRDRIVAHDCGRMAGRSILPKEKVLPPPSYTGQIQITTVLL